MKMLPANRPLARISHDELIRLLVANPQNRGLAKEFISRYDAVIHQTVTREIYKRMANVCFEAIRSMSEDAVSETYCRLFKNDCQVLRSFKCRHENSIFAYLRKIAHSAVSNQFRAHWRRNVCGPWQSFDKIEGKYDDGACDDGPMVWHADLTASQTTERKSIEEVLRANFRLAFRHANVNRNFIIFKLHFLYGYHSHEIAYIKGLGLSERGVGNTTDRIRQCLRKRNKENKWIKTLNTE